MDIRHEVNRQKITNRGETYIPLKLAMRIAAVREAAHREEDAREIEALEMLQGILEDALLDVMPLVKRVNFDLWVITMRRIGAVVDPRVMQELVGKVEEGEVVRRWDRPKVRAEDEAKFPWVRLLDERAKVMLDEHIAGLILEGRVNDTKRAAKLVIDNDGPGHDPYNHQPPIR